MPVTRRYMLLAFAARSMPCRHACRHQPSPRFAIYVYLSLFHFERYAIEKRHLPRRFDATPDAEMPSAQPSYALSTPRNILSLRWRLFTVIAMLDTLPLRC